MIYSAGEYESFSDKVGQNPSCYAAMKWRMEGNIFGLICKSYHNRLHCDQPQEIIMEEAS